ncbi:LPS translocon maturation chaperone LptM [Legionella impletisoli]|nr:lipoprotein [Legionella impletisoli]
MTTAKHLRNLFKRSIGLFILICLLGACGQKGPLYLPEPHQGESKQS